MGQFNASMEAIAFQISADLPKAITNIFQKILDIKAARPETDKLLEELGAITKQATGLYVLPRLMDGPHHKAFNMFVLDPNFNAFSPINEKASALIAKYDLQNVTKIDILKGTIDRKNGRVTGFYGTIPFGCGISMVMFDGTFTAGELASIYGHEVGHPWVICEFLGQTLLTNVILAELVGRMDVQTSEARKFALARCALQLADADQKIPENVTSSEITALVLEGQVKRMQKAYNTRWYDQRLAEAMADQFAARWGMGKDLVVALGKLERAKGFSAEGGYDNMWLGILGNLLNFVLLPYGVTMAAGGQAAILQVIRRLAVSFSVSFFLGGTTYGLKADTYPPMRARIQAIRNEIVHLLKDRDLPKDVRERALEDLKVIDAEAGNVHPFANVMSQLAAYALDVVSGKHHVIGANQMKENLANNRFFEFSATHQR